MLKSRKLIIVGDSSFAEVAHQYFMEDSHYQVVAFSVEQAFIKKDTLFGLPVVPFETLPEAFSPVEHDVFVAIVYTQLNRLRTRLYRQVKAHQYALASYISPRAFIKTKNIGEHCFIFEDNVIQPFVKIGNNVILWSGNHIGHHSEISDHCFISSHVVISGHCTIGESCFLGVNSTVADNVSIEKDTVLGAGTLILKSTEAAKIYKGSPSQPSQIDTRKFYKIKE